MLHSVYEVTSIVNYVINYLNCLGHNGIFNNLSFFFEKSLFNSRLDYFWQRASLMSHQILDSHIVKINYKVNVRFKFLWRLNRPRGYESKLNYRIIWSISLLWVSDVKIRFSRLWIDRELHGTWSSPVHKFSIYAYHQHRNSVTNIRQSSPT